MDQNIKLNYFSDKIVAWLTETRPLSRSMITLGEYQNAEANFLEKNETVSLYLHFPFCEKLCSYCDLNIAVTRDQKLRTEYLNALIEEIKTRIPKRKKLKAVYLGGGTPSNLSNLNFEQLFSFLYEYFEKDDNLKVFIDVHPKDLSMDLMEEKLNLFKHWGISEIRLGIEDVDQNILENVNRHHGQINLLQLVTKIREKGFIIGGSFLIGLPNQSQTHLENLHHEILKLPLDFFTVRSLRISSFNSQNMHLFGNGQALSKDKILNNMFLIHQKLKFDTSLKPLGFGFYSRLQTNFIRTELGFMPDSFHNYLGFGVGSISSLGKIFQMQNPLHFNQYLAYALYGKKSSNDSLTKDIRAYQLGEDQLPTLKKREKFVSDRLTKDVDMHVKNLEQMLDLRLHELNQLNHDGIFFLEALVNEI